ncbi:hypothetical protein [Planktotalea sp.]|uniref:hypothetical protein n=1 Tax=Planktotalea sp. TaxID=2029877 RepID=UPI0032986B22
MSIGICDLNTSKARISGFALVCCVALSACSDGEGLSFAPKVSSEAANAAQTSPAIPKTTQTTFARGSIKLKAPKGYCIDETSIQNGLNGSSAMLSTCTALDGKGSGTDAAVMSVSISPRGGATATNPRPQDLAQAVTPHKVLQQTQQGNLALIKVATGGDEAFGPADPTHWRGATMLDTRLVLFGLFAPEGSELTGNKGATLLTSLARGLSATRGSLLGLNTSQTDEDDQPKAVREIAGPDTVDTAKKGTGGFIARLLNRS